MDSSSRFVFNDAVAIADKLVSSLPPPDTVDGIGMRGVSGIILLVSAASRHSDKYGYEAIADKYIARAGELLNGRISSTLFAGLAGIALASYQCDVAFGRNPGNKYGDIQSALLKVLKANPETLQFDHISGVVGIAAYCHATISLPGSKEILNVALEVLDKKATSLDGEYWWNTPVVWLPAEYSEIGKPVTNLGLAHGVPGVIALLSALHRDDLLPSSSMKLLIGACHWLKKRIYEGIDKRFVIGYLDGFRATSREAWCYGAPGVGYALALAGAVLDDKELLSTAAGLLNHYQSSPSVSYDSTLEGPILCHGYAGVAHMLYRTNQILTKHDIDTGYLEDHCFNMYAKANSLLQGCILSTPLINPFNKSNWYDFLEGLSGASMSLLALKEDERSPWEALLLTQ